MEITETSKNQYIDELSHIAIAQPRIEMIKVVNKVNTTSATISAGKHLKVRVALHPAEPLNVVSCMNEETFHALFPKVKLSVCPHEIQNIGN